MKKAENRSYFRPAGPFKRRNRASSGGQRGAGGRKEQEHGTAHKDSQQCTYGLLQLTTHRLDIYDESRAKVQFLEELEGLEGPRAYSTEALASLPTAYDYIRLGHPLSCVLEWSLATLNGVPATHVIAFASRTMALLAVLRRRLWRAARR